MNSALFIIENFGFLLILSAIGLWHGKKQEKIWTLPLFFILVSAFIFRFTWHGNIDQKLLFFGGLFFVVWAAKGCVVLLKKSFFFKMLAFLLFFFSTLSGVIDIMVIKNDFMYPVKDAAGEPFMQWIKDYAAPNAVFLAPPDIFDPIVLSGRQNYWGFFKNFQIPPRSAFVKEVFEATEAGILRKATSEGIDYLVVLKFEKADFQYAVNKDILRTLLSVVYEDDRFIVFRMDRGTIEKEKKYTIGL